MRRRRPVRCRWRQGRYGRWVGVAKLGEHAVRRDWPGAMGGRTPESLAMASPVPPNYTKGAESPPYAVNASIRRQRRQAGATGSAGGAHLCQAAEALRLLAAPLRAFVAAHHLSVPPYSRRREGLAGSSGLDIACSGAGLIPLRSHPVARHLHDAALEARRHVRVEVSRRLPLVRTRQGALQFASTVSMLLLSVEADAVSFSVPASSTSASIVERAQEASENRASCIKRRVDTAVTARHHWNGR